VRTLSAPQIGRTWWPNAKWPGVPAIEEITKLEKEGLVSKETALVHPELSLKEPVCSWSPGDGPPEFGTVAYKLQSRWVWQPRAELVVIATSKAANWMGGHGGRFPRPSEATHDVHLGSVFVHYLTSKPRLARKWISEAELHERGEGREDRLPDAMIITRAGKTVIEFGGAYKRKKVEAFHGYCESRGLSYELW
jgi:hypothetical protein